jgi:plasmid segregation protein ParM
MKTMIESVKATYIGVDDGHYGVKVVDEHGGMWTIASRAVSGKQLFSWQGGQGGDDIDGSIYTADEGAVFTVSEHLTKHDDTRYRDYPVSAHNRALVHHALRKAGYAGKRVSIATGLPVSYYYLGGNQNDVLIAAKMANLQKGMRCDRGDCAKIVENVVTSEAIAAYFDQIIQMDGSPSAVFEEFIQHSVGVIDVGGKTTDCAVVLPGGRNVDTDRSGSSDVGVLKLNDVVEARLRTQFEFDNVPTTLVERAIRTGVVRVAGKDESIKDFIDSAKETLAEAIMGNVRAKIGTGKDLSEVLFVGGGSIVMRDQITKYFPHARFPEHPEYANARGMLKIAKYVKTQKE